MRGSVAFFGPSGLVAVAALTGACASGVSHSAPTPLSLELYTVPTTDFRGFAGSDVGARTGPEVAPMRESKSGLRVMQQAEIMKFIRGRRLSDVPGTGTIISNPNAEFFGSACDYQRRGDLVTVYGTYMVNGDRLCVRFPGVASLFCRRFFESSKGQVFEQGAGDSARSPSWTRCPSDGRHLKKVGPFRAFNHALYGRDPRNSRTMSGAGETRRDRR